MHRCNEPFHFCGMHPLDTFAKSVEKTVKIWEDEQKTEKAFDTMSFKPRSCSETYALMHTVGRLCFKDGAGLPAEIKTHL